MKVIILAGGGGSRLFPLSRQSYPKQFLALEDDRSLLAHTVARFLPLVAAADILVVTNARYRYHVEHELASCGASETQVLLEPVGRNTAPAIALGVTYARERLGAGDGEVFLVAAADHVIRPEEEFAACMKRGARVAATEDALVTFGIPAKSPETGYGYIETEPGATGESVAVRSFKEKPDEATAKRYVAAGNYYWNSGMFAFTAGLLCREMAAYAPEIAAEMGSLAGLVEHFDALPSISVDYALAEQSRRVRMVPLTCFWSDIGSWDAMYDLLPKDESGNACRGDCLTLDCQDSLILGRDRLIAGIGLKDILLVETDDVIVAMPRGDSQRVKEVVAKLKKMGRREATQHTTIYHAWGKSSIIGRGERYRIKKVEVAPGKEIGLQLHYHRSEHWIILRGTAEVTRGEEKTYLSERESAFIPQTMKHRLRNPGRIPLELIEIQTGAYIGEEDIVRFDDEEDK